MVDKKKSFTDLTVSELVQCKGLVIMIHDEKYRNNLISITKQTFNKDKTTNICIC